VRLSHVGRAAFLVRFSSLLPRCRHVRACLGSGILLASAALVVACDALAAPPFFRPLSRRAKTKVYMGDGGMRMRRPLGGAQSCNEATFERSGGLNPVELINLETAVGRCEVHSVSEISRLGCIRLGRGGAGRGGGVR